MSSSTKTTSPSVNSTSDLNVPSLPRAQHTVEGSAFELECIQLLCNLESLMAGFRDKPIGERIETASRMAGEFLLQLIEFSGGHFEDEQAKSLMEQVQKAMEYRKNHDERLNKRSWSSALKSLISSNAIDPATFETYDKLGKGLIYVCGEVFKEMLRLVSGESGFRSQLNQSTVVFLEELKGVWL